MLIFIGKIKKYNRGDMEKYNRLGGLIRNERCVEKNKKKILEKSNKGIQNFVLKDLEKKHAKK